MATPLWFWRESRRPRHVDQRTSREVQLDANELSKRFRHYLSYESWATREAARREAASAATVAAEQHAEAARRSRARRSHEAYEAWLAEKRPAKVEVPAEETRRNDCWRSRTWRADLDVSFHREAPPQRQRKDVEHRANVMLRWYFLRLRRYCAWRRWLRRKHRERQLVAEDRPASAARAARARREKDKWRRPEWRRVQGLEGRLGATRATRREQRRQKEATQRQITREISRERGWTNVF